MKLPDDLIVIGKYLPRIRMSLYSIVSCEILFTYPGKKVLIIFCHHKECNSLDATQI